MVEPIMDCIYCLAVLLPGRVIHAEQL